MPAPRRPPLCCAPTTLRVRAAPGPAIQKCGRGQRAAAAGPLRVWSSLLGCADKSAPWLPLPCPAGFTIVDVMAWGALGHAAAFYLLATSSLTASPVPF